MSKVTSDVMELLRERARHFGNQRIHENVERVLESKLESGESLTLLTPMCVATTCLNRFIAGNGVFQLTKGERDLFSRDLPTVANFLRRRGLQLEWYYTFNRPYPDPARISPEAETAYIQFVNELAAPLTDQGWFMTLRWEDEVTGGRPQPHPEVLRDRSRFISESQLEQRLRRTLERIPPAERATKEAELRKWATYKIACEAEEGRFLDSGDSPFGKDFLLVPLEDPEQFDAHTLLAPNFRHRILDILPHYPWRG
jgi:hypothetical protein